MGVTSSALNCICFACPWGPTSVARYLHVFLFILMAIVAFSWTFLSGSIQAPTFDNVTNELTVQSQYFGPWIVMLAVVVYHLSLSLLLIGVHSSRDRRALIQNGMWPVKVIALLLICLLLFALPPPVALFKYAFYVAGLASIAFLALQSVYLVDFAYRGAELLVEKYEESEGDIWKYSLFGITGLLYTLGVFMTVVILIYNPNLLLVGMGNLIIMIVISISSILEEVQEANPQAGIFQAAFISFYNSFLLCSSSAHEQSALRRHVTGWETAVNVVSCLLFGLGLVYYATTIEQASDSDVENDLNTDEEQNDYCYSMSLFHLYLALAACFVVLSLTNWRQVIPNGNGKFVIGDVSERWCKWSPIVASWLLSGLYMFSLFAPLIFPDRQF